MMRIALLGNPNVGKSVLFSKITGIGVISSNYPGTTVEFEEGKITFRGETLLFYDLPGIYSLSGISEDEIVATKLLAEKKPDILIVVADATRLVQSIVLILQLIELGYRVIVALNFMDIARRRYKIDTQLLSRILEIPVIPTVAITGEGINDLLSLISNRTIQRSSFVVRYDTHIERILQELADHVKEWKTEYNLRGALLKLLEGNHFFSEFFCDEVKNLSEELKIEFENTHHETIDVHIGRDRYGEAGRIASQVVGEIEREETLGEKVSRITIRPITGIPILILILATVFLSIVYLGGFIESWLVETYKKITEDLFSSLASFIGGQIGIAISRGIDLSLQAILSIVIPYIFVFYLILAILEDTGYLPRTVALLDGLMHRLGLHGRAIIPMIVGVGCNVPAILATRILESKRERLILATLIVMSIPCSAQLAIIFGVVGHYGGLTYALGIIAILFLILLAIGRLMHKLVKLEPSSVAMEMPDLVIPKFKNIFFKTYIRIRDFFIVAFPILFIGSLLLEVLIEFQVLEMIVEPMSFLTLGLLGLPSVTIIALIFGILRKEMAFQLLVLLFGTTNLALVLSPNQLFVFGLVMATYIPCLSTIAVLLREFNAKKTLMILLFSLMLSLAMGTIANFLLTSI
ncbi:MAG: ferrous iron transport protein B [Methanomassiliicoccales archaeon]